ncbi:hypothetical protein OsJ_27463 [Oryza sativa Japonica Group]|uniref:Uncharacterized protein n=1 Tax=Oryza sativa subsp. japonica TaxID=39947 RepID=A3BTI1_ORYSJ|nr:hypothetical protein OsJ_27463 [Oryza sativa Japonica Group]
MVSAADAVIPACAAVGIAFAVWQWLLVSRVKVSPYSAAAGPARNGGAGRAVFRPEGEVDDDDGGCGDDEEADGDGGVAAMARCAEIQSAIRVDPVNFRIGSLTTYLALVCTASAATDSSGSLVTRHGSILFTRGKLHDELDLLG